MMGTVRAPVQRRPEANGVNGVDKGKGKARAVDDEQERREEEKEVPILPALQSLRVSGVGCRDLVRLAGFRRAGAARAPLGGGPRVYGRGGWKAAAGDGGGE